jgi:uncharacterized protein (TIGR02099 family)
MALTTTTFWPALRSATLRVLAFWVLLFAAYLALGRQFFPYIERLKPEVETWLSTQVGAPVSIGRLQGEWERFNPVVQMTDIQIGETLSMAKLTLAPGLYESISRGGLSFIRFELSDFSAELVQTALGWQMQGLATAEGEGVKLNDLILLLQRQQEVQFTNTHLTLRPLTLPSFDLTLNQGRLSGTDSEIGLVADAVFTADGFDIPLQLQVETRQNGSQANRAYFKHAAIDIAPWIQAVDAEVSQVLVAGEYWVSFDQHHVLDMTARLQSDLIALDGSAATLQIQDLKADAYLERQADGFDGWLNLLSGRSNGQVLPATKAHISRRADRLTLQWDRLAIDIIGQWFALNDPGGFWRGLQANGFLDQGQLTRLDQQPESWQLTAAVTGLTTSPVEAVPGVEKLNGMLQMDGNRGQLRVSGKGVPIDLPELYANAPTAEALSMQLAWQADAEQGVISEGKAELILAVPEQTGAGVIAKPLPLHLQWQSTSPNARARQMGTESALELQVTAAQLDAPWVQFLANNRLLTPEAVRLIDARLRGGDFSRAEFNYLTRSDKVLGARSQYFINTSVVNLEMAFLDDWSPVQGVAGEFTLTDAGLSFSGFQGQYPGFKLLEMDAALNFSTQRITTRVKALASGREALQFLQTGPLQLDDGARFTDWASNAGEIDVLVQLEWPLQQLSAPEVSIDADLRGVALTLGGLDLSLTDINGRLSYHSLAGLRSSGLSLIHQDHLQRATLASDNGTAFSIALLGRTPVAYWGERVSDGFLRAQNVSVAHQTLIRIDPGHTRIESQSDLIGLALPLPAPLAKAAQAPMALDLSINFDQRGWTTLAANLDNSLTSYLELDADNAVQRGAIAINEPLRVRAENGVYFDIQVDQADADSWWQFVQSFNQRYPAKASPSPSRSFESMIAEINIRAQRLVYLAQPWSNVVTTLLRADNAWLISFDSDEGQAEVAIPHGPEPIFADVQWVALTSAADQIPFVDQLDPLLNYLPSDVPDLSLQINKLIWNQRDLGNWRAEVRVKDGVLTASDLVGQMPGATLNGDLLWTRDKAKHRTDFNGSIRTGNLADVLTTWGYAPVLTTRDGKLDVTTFWQGSPAHFDFKRLQGDISLKFNQGAILDVPEYEGVKLIGLLNFTRVLNRIAFDFSDLLRTGITFDTIIGELLFDRGFARVGEKLVIDGSATKFRFSGDADLLSDELDVDMTLTVPLSSTFPLVALLAGVSPQAAAAIYVTERVFNNQLERLSSARMHITGSFEAPDTRFYRVGSDRLAEPSGQADSERE